MNGKLQTQTESFLLESFAKVVMATLITEKLEQYQKEGRYFHQPELEDAITKYVETSTLKGKLKVTFPLVYEDGRVLCRLSVNNCVWHEFIAPNVIIDYLKKLGLYKEN